MLKLPTTVFIPHDSQVMLEIPQASLQQFMNQELSEAGFQRRGGTRVQIVSIWWIMEKAKVYQRNICFIDCAKSFDYVDPNKLWKILQEMGISDHLTCLPRNQVKRQQLEPDVGEQTGSKLGGVR